MRALHLSSTFILVLAVLRSGTNTASAALCADRVASGDQSIGISAVEDAACASGGLGCFPDGDQCRFCKTSNDSQSAHLMLCSDVPVSMISTESATATPGMLESVIDCVSRVSVGDQGVGISAIAASTASCARDSLGCFESNTCRFCQSRATAQSAPFAKCSSYGTSTGTSSTSRPASTPAATAASTSTRCSSVVSSSGLSGISYVSESRCNVASPSLLGCSARTSCRLCRNSKNEANQYLMSCQVLKDQGATGATGTTESATASSASTMASSASTTASTASTTKTTTEAIDSTAPGTVTTDSEEAGTVTIDSTVPDTVGMNASKLSTSTQTEGKVATVAAAGTPIFVAAAVVALLVVVMMTAMYVKGRRDPTTECLTPDDDGPSGLLTPHGGRGYTPREGSLVMVVSQTSIATL